jgi:ribose-phosphate pyrophosphokinase
VAKDRVNADEVKVKSVIGPDVTGCSVLLVDDLTESAGTLVAASEALFARGAVRVAAAVSHGVLLQKGLDRLAASRIEVLFTTDSVPVPDVPKIRRCSIAPLLAKAIWSIHRDESVTELFAVP